MFNLALHLPPSPPFGLQLRQVVWKLSIDDPEFPEALAPWVAASNCSSPVGFPIWLSTLLGETVDWLETSESLVLDVILSPITLPLRLAGLTRTSKISTHDRILDVDDEQEIPGEMDLPDLEDGELMQQQQSQSQWDTLPAHARPRFSIQVR